MVIITGPPEAQFKVSAKDNAGPAGSGDSPEVLRFFCGSLVFISLLLFTGQTRACFLVSPLCSAFSLKKGGFVCWLPLGMAAPPAHL